MPLPSDQRQARRAPSVPRVVAQRTAATAVRGAGEPPGPPGPPGPPRTWNALVVAVPAAAVGVLGYRHRWVGDDALIYTRAVRQILAGNGPLLNIGERAEASTGTLWQWLLALGGLVTGADPAVLAVALGLLSTAAGWLVAGDAARRLHGRTAPLVPAGVLVLLPVCAVWDYATSGLETGLVTCWLAACWWLLAGEAHRHRVVTAVVLGLGPLVRPDMGLVSVVFLGVWCVLLRAGWRTTAGLVAVACVLPGAYEAFRAGYYGVLVPLPGITKEASGTNWGRGLLYAENFVLPYRLWFPLLVLAALGSFLVVRRTRRGAGGSVRAIVRLPRRPVLLAAAPLVSGTLSLLYVVRVGGDFMHGRMLLPGLFLLLLPVWALPRGRAVVAAGTALAVWAGCCLLLWRPPVVSGSGEIWDTHVGYQRATRNPYPVTQQLHGARPTRYRAEIARALRADRPQLVLETVYNRPHLMFPLARNRHAPVAGAMGFLGHNGIVVPLDGLAVDPLSLAHPLGAHMERSATARAGHEKPVAVAWLVAEYTDPGTPLPRGVDPRAVAAARHALTCGPLPELRDSVRQSMGPGRFWRNLTGSWRRTAFRFPAEPRAAEAALCPRP
ncbi:hypothetical protein ACFWZ2_29115 [Streptomyces sp. NPDC059002]|uniref:hypothetical protein n=1 Tax=Streptomyces sp. NPDC059002 TaxID=3346690 RepID=UPI003674DC58